MGKQSCQFLMYSLLLFPCWYFFFKWLNCLNSKQTISKCRVQTFLAISTYFLLGWALEAFTMMLGVISWLNLMNFNYLGWGWKQMIFELFDINHKFLCLFNLLFHKFLKHFHKQVKIWTLKFNFFKSVIVVNLSIIVEASGTERVAILTDTWFLGISQKIDICSHAIEPYWLSSELTQTGTPLLLIQHLTNQSSNEIIKSLVNVN